MVKKLIFCVGIIGMQAALNAADPELVKRLNQSSPTKTKQASSAIKRSKDRSSAPGRLSSEEARKRDDESPVALEYAESPVQSKKAFSDSSVQRSKFVSKSPPTKRQLFGSSNVPKFFFVSADMFDEMLLEGIDQNRREVKKVAQDNDLKGSNFYRIIKIMRPELVQASSDVVMFANYFLCMVASEDSCKSYLAGTPSLIPVPSHDFNVCVQSIRFYLDTVTHNAITWPEVKREDNKELYYVQLLEKNKTIHVADVSLYYYGAAVAIGLLSQIRDRSLNLKPQFKSVSDSPKRAQKHLRELVNTFAQLAMFVPSLNVSFKKVEQQDDQE